MVSYEVEGFLFPFFFIYLFIFGGGNVTNSKFYIKGVFKNFEGATGK